MARKPNGKAAADASAPTQATDIITVVASSDVANNADIATADIGIVVPTEIIKYEDGVAQGKALVARLDADWWALCELATRLEPKYDEQTHKRFFAEIGIDSVGERRLSVFRAWQPIFASWAADGNPALGPSSVPYTVLRELQDHPKRDEHLKSNPTMKKADAVKVMKAHRKKTRVRSWRRDEITEQLDQIEDAAKNLKRLELKLVKDAADYRLLLEVVAARRKEWLANVRAGGDAAHRSADLIEHLEQHITEIDRERGATEDAAVASLEAYRAKATEALG